jgi:hypothetical protein
MITEGVQEISSSSTTFPFTDLKGSKNRPAVVLYSNSVDVTICFITTELKWQRKERYYY